MNNTVHSSTATSPQSPPPQLAAARPSLTIDIHAAQNKNFTLHDNDSPQFRFISTNRTHTRLR